MKSFAKLLTVVVAAIVFSIGMGAAPAQARDGGLAFNLALDFRTVDTYFVRSPQYFDGSFSLTGLKAEGQFDIRADKLTISPGLGLAYFFSGEYDYTAAGPTTYTGKDATAVEVDLFVQGAYEVAPKISVNLERGWAWRTWPSSPTRTPLARPSTWRSRTSTSASGASMKSRTNSPRPSRTAS